MDAVDVSTEGVDVGFNVRQRVRASALIATTEEQLLPATRREIENPRLVSAWGVGDGSTNDVKTTRDANVPLPTAGQWATWQLHPGAAQQKRLLGSNNSHDG